ncbi:MAG TPA: phage holin family protein [Candidatus Saccharimonadales bacterium]|nr:phage holin family protein [Candidatus Saccharimonadales bacterium]
MPALLVRWIILTVSVMLAGVVIHGFQVNNVFKAFLAAVVLSLLNAILRPVLILLTLPINVLTLGLFVLVINAFLLWLTSVILPGAFRIDGLWPLFLASLLISVLSGLLNWLVKKESRK